MPNSRNPMTLIGDALQAARARLSSSTHRNSSGEEQVQDAADEVLETLDTTAEAGKLQDAGKKAVAFKDTNGQSVECVDNRGVLIPIIAGSFSETMIYYLRAGNYESPEAGELDALIQPDEVILEIGAGCGFISTYCAMNPNAKEVYCVEANPKLIEVIKLTHKINNVDVMLFHEILANEEGETNFYVHEDFWASGTRSFQGESVKVKTTPFQTRLDQIRPTMLIVDIEGGEETLFEDVNLTGVKKILLELHQLVIGRRGMKKVFDILSAQDFHYDMWHSSHSIVTFSHVDRI